MRSEARQEARKNEGQSEERREAVNKREVGGEEEGRTREKDEWQPNEKMTKVRKDEGFSSWPSSSFSSCSPSHFPPRSSKPLTADFWLHTSEGAEAGPRQRRRGRKRWQNACLADDLRSADVSGFAFFFTAIKDKKKTDLSIFLGGLFVLIYFTRACKFLRLSPAGLTGNLCSERLPRLH